MSDIAIAIVITCLTMVLLMIGAYLNKVLALLAELHGEVGYLVEKEQARAGVPPENP